MGAERDAASPRAGYRSTLIMPHRLSSRAPSFRYALSPDGRRLAYVGSDSGSPTPRVWIRSLASTLGDLTAVARLASEPPVRCLHRIYRQPMERARRSTRLEEEMTRFILRLLWTTGDDRCCPTGQPTARAESPSIIATFSDVARDPATGELGVAVQSRYFAIGAAVPFAEGDVGAIASQALGNALYGSRGLQLLRVARSVQDMLRILLDEDLHRDVRQVGIVDARRQSLAHTRAKTFPWAGHRTGPNSRVRATYG